MRTTLNKSEYDDDGGLLLLMTTTAIVSTGTTTAILDTATTTAIVISLGLEAGGTGAGTSQQVGVSLVDKQIREIVPPKQKRLLESQFVIRGKLQEALEVPVRVRSQLKALMNESELTISSNIQDTLKTSLQVKSFPLVNLSARVAITSKVTEKVTTPRLKITGEQDYSDFDRLIELAKLLD